MFRGLANLSRTVPIEKWCLIGGLMVDVLLRQRGRTHLRPTEDGDVVGDVVADRRILRTISLALRDQGFEIEETGLRFDFGVRHRKEEGVYIDLLAPANSARLKSIWQPKAGLKTLAAPGSDSAMATCDTRHHSRRDTIRRPHDPCADARRCDPPESVRMVGVGVQHRTRQTHP